MTLTEAIRVLKEELPEDEYFSLRVVFTRYGTSTKDNIEFGAYAETQNHFEGNTLNEAVNLLITDRHSIDSPVDVPSQEEVEAAFSEAESLVNPNAESDSIPGPKF